MYTTEAPILAHHYRLGMCLGQGQMTVAYRVDHLPTHQSCVAILLLLPETDARTRERFLLRFQDQTEEIRALPAHPLLLQLIDAGVWHGIPYLLFPETAEAPPLCSIQHFPLPPKEAFTMVASVACGLAHVHMHGLTHGNLTAASVIASVNQTVLIAGLGLRSLLEAQGLETVEERPYAHLRSLWGSYVGDPYTLAPECLLARRCDPRSDIYSLGVLLYLMLTGHVPFAVQSRSYLATAMQSLHEPIPLLEKTSTTFPRGTDDMLQHLLARKPEQRWQSMQEVEQACLALCEQIECI